MIDSPKVVLRASTAAEWSAAGPKADRAVAFARAFVSTLSVDEQSAYALDIEQCPEAHAGLGSGTALALAVARAIALETGHGAWQAVELAGRVGRGKRSAVGVHGFQHGGFIVEAGKTPDERIGALVGSYEFPSEWRIVLARPAIDGEWHGSRERRAFECLTHGNPTESLWKLISTGMLPALQAKQFDAFTDALHEYNARAGEAFADQQGGVYAGPAVIELVSSLRKHGVHGVGQSSWGPTVFALTRDVEEAQNLVQFMRERLGMDGRQLGITGAAPCK
jgi:beta-RFAP synthase